MFTWLCCRAVVLSGSVSAASLAIGLAWCRLVLCVCACPRQPFLRLHSIRAVSAASAPQNLIQRAFVCRFRYAASIIKASMSPSP